MNALAELYREKAPVDAAANRARLVKLPQDPVVLETSFIDNRVVTKRPVKSRGLSKAVLKDRKLVPMQYSAAQKRKLGFRD